MAYVDNRTGRSQRATVMVAVALIQGAAIIALVNGLAVKIFDRPEQIRTSGAQMPLEPPPKPEPPRPIEKQIIDRPVTQTIDTIPINTGPVIGTIPIGPTVIGDPPPVEIVQPDPPRPPVFTPQRAKPRGNPGDWVSANDYPTRDLREGNQGVTGFRLTVGIDGRAQSCSVTHSSGFAGLDEATCRNLLRRARFDPAKDGSGNPVASEYASNIRWVIPD